MGEIMRGGARPGAGRPKGSRNVDERMIREARQQGIPIKGTSLDFLQRVYRNEIKNADPKRIEAARAAAPFEFPRLTDATVRQRSDYDEMPEEQLAVMAKGFVHELLPAMATEDEHRQKLIAFAKEHLGLIEPATNNVVPLKAAT